MDSTYDIIVVGSGAGGGPLAARLAEYGMSVLVIEAAPRRVDRPDEDVIREVTEVPAFHPLAADHPDLDWPGTEPGDPRRCALGGTADDEGITILGPQADWADLVSRTGDGSWAAERMRGYFQRLERCQYRRRPPGRRTEGYLPNLWAEVRRVVGQVIDASAGGHGFDGWLTTEVPDTAVLSQDPVLRNIFEAAARHASDLGLDLRRRTVRQFLRGAQTPGLDPNDERTRRSSPEGLAFVPVAADSAVGDGRRSGPQRRLLDVEARSRAGTLAGRLEIWTDCCVRRVLVEEREGELVASGVEIQVDEGEAGPTIREVCALREVVLSAGVLHTPKLLMHSGIGDRSVLEAHGIPVRAHRPGVGRNLRYNLQVDVITRLAEPIPLLRDAAFLVPGQDGAPDRHLQEWRDHGSGLYASHGIWIGLFQRARPEATFPELFLAGRPEPFRSPGPPPPVDQFSWSVLKTHIGGMAGAITLRSSDPVAPCAVRFDGPHAASQADVDALVDGMRTARGIMGKLSDVSERVPGPSLPDDREQMRSWVRQHARPRHAAGTCALGGVTDRRAVVDSKFRVLGRIGADGRAQPVIGLRVVDASIFPRVPGYCPAVATYMVSEKAADVLAEAIL